MTKKNQNFIALFGLLIFFVGILVFAAAQGVFAFSLAMEAKAAEMVPPIPPDITSGAPSPATEENNAVSQEPASALPEGKIGAGNLEQRIQDIEARGKNLETWNSIITALFIISLLFNVYFGLKVRHILKKIGTTTL